MSFRTWYRRYRTLWVSLVACAAFLALAVYGWGVTWGDLASGLLVTLALLVILVLCAAGLGWVVYKVRNRR